MDGLHVSVLDKHPLAFIPYEIIHLPARAIVERAAALPADCVAIGHHGQSAVAEPPLGSLALHVLHHTLRDVLVVPPQAERV